MVKVGEATGAVTVVVLTALEVERRAVLKHMVKPCGDRDEAGNLYEVAALPTPGWRLVLGSQARGNSDAAVLTTQAIGRFAPVVVVFVGIAGGLWPSVGLGDVVVATKVYGIHGGREEPEGFWVRPEAWEPR